jgi:phage/plasmid-like protein (TIGR03299 family)
MPAYFNEGVFVEKSAWHRLGRIVSADEAAAMTRSEWALASGHDYRVVAVPNANLERMPLTEDEFQVQKLDRNADIARVGGQWFGMKVNPDKKGLRISQTRDGQPGPLDGKDIEVVNQSLAIIQNEVAYDFADALQDLGFVRWAGIVLRDGAECALTFKLNEPIQISGDNSQTLPFFVLNWAHDGSGSLRGRSTSIRAECWNTVSAGEAQGKRLGTEFSIKHTENWGLRVEDAKKAILGARADIEAYREVMEEFAAVPVNRFDRELFVHALVLDQKAASVARFKADAAKGVYTPRVQDNVAKAIRKVNGLFDGPTIPEDHKLTAYGLHLAGVEYLDHVRKAQSEATKVGRSLLRDEPAKARLTPLIRDIVSAAR